MHTSIIGNRSPVKVGTGKLHDINKCFNLGVNLDGLFSIGLLTQTLYCCGAFNLILKHSQEQINSEKTYQKKTISNITMGNNIFD